MPSRPAGARLSRLSSSTASHAGWVGLSLLLCFAVRVPIAQAAIDAAAAEPARSVRHGGATTLDDRVTAFTKALELDASQQAQLRRILMEQRETVRKIWIDKGLS